MGSVTFGAESEGAPGCEAQRKAAELVARGLKLGEVRGLVRVA